MRGKNILWLTLAMIMLSTAMTDISFAQTPATIQLDPMYVSGYLPGQLFDVNIMITGAENVYAWGFELHFAPYVNLLAVNTMTEGSFLQGGGSETYFAKYYNGFEGLVKMGATIVGGAMGVTGSGFLATVTFQVIEAGECPLELTNVELLDPDMFPLDYTLATMYVGTMGPYTGYYYGPTALFVMGKVDTRVISLSKRTHQGFDSKMENAATVPLYTRVNYRMTRLEDGLVRNLWTDPTLKYINVDGYTGDRTDWTLTGTAPYLSGYNDGSYVESLTPGHVTGDYTFGDIPVLPGKAYGAMLSILCWDTGGYWYIPGYGWTYNNNKLLIYVWDGNVWNKVTVWPNAYPQYGYWWITADISSYANTVDKVNGLKMYFEYEDGLGPVGTIRIDYVDVTLYEWGSPLAVGENRDMNHVDWPVTTADIGTWYVEVAGYYRYAPPPGNVALPAIWNRALKGKTLTFKVVP